MSFSCAFFPISPFFPRRNTVFPRRRRLLFTENASDSFHHIRYARAPLDVAPSKACHWISCHGKNTSIQALKTDNPAEELYFQPKNMYFQTRNTHFQPGNTHLQLENEDYYRHWEVFKSEREVFGRAWKSIHASIKPQKRNGGKQKKSKEPTDGAQGLRDYATKERKYQKYWFYAKHCHTCLIFRV